MIRPATPNDVQAMADLEVSEPMGSQWTAVQIGEDLEKNDAIVLVIETNGQINGHAIAWCIAGELEVMTLAVSPKCRRMGLGMTLLQALLAKRTHSKAFLELRESNQAALSLYTRAGFEIVGRRKRYYRDGEDALIMRWVNPN
jgi:ribosomal-protein-alanine N-acetyltransferase